MAQPAYTAPHQVRITLPVPPTAAGANYSETLAFATFAGFVAMAVFIPAAAVAGVPPNTRNLQVVNIGAGAVAAPGVPASLGVAASLPLPAGAANVADALTVVTPPVYTLEIDPGFNYVGENPNTGATGSSTYTPPVITLTPNSFQPGDVLQYQSNTAGTGVADPGGTLIVLLERAGNV